jgi:hypothetical protein
LSLSACGCSLPSINCNYIFQMSYKEIHKYVCLIWRETWIIWMTFPSPVTKSDGKAEVMANLAWLPIFLRRPVGRLGDWP